MALFGGFSELLEQENFDSLKRKILTVWKEKFWQFGKGKFWQFGKKNFDSLERKILTVWKRKILTVWKRKILTVWKGKFWKFGAGNFEPFWDYFSSLKISQKIPGSLPFQVMVIINLHPLKINGLDTREAKQKPSIQTKVMQKSNLPLYSTSATEIPFPGRSGNLSLPKNPKIPRSSNLPASPNQFLYQKEKHRSHFPFFFLVYYFMISQRTRARIFFLFFIVVSLLIFIRWIIFFISFILSFSDIQ